MLSLRGFGYFCCDPDDVAHLERDDVVTAWSTYKSCGDLETRNELVLHYSSLVQYVATKLAAGLPNTVERDDLVSYGTFGLLEAMENFDLSKGIKFETFAVARIRGSMIDGLRKLDWVPRSVRAKARDIDKATTELTLKLGRQPEDAELAAHLGITLAEYWALSSQAQVTSVTALEEYDGDSDRMSISETTFDVASNPEDLFAATEITHLLAGAIDVMPERHKIILVLYYFHEMTLAEIGEVLGVTESRVCQLQSKVLQTLREALSQGALSAA